jgi:prolyl-tRNA editing enzyme YbaK/EbsC (Cys-tRNA(Pro) deacylase)
MLTTSDLKTFMKENNLVGEIILLEEATPTVEAAASALGTTKDRIVKSVLFTIGEKKILAITRGTRYIEQRAIAAHFNVGRKRVKLASAEVVLSVTGYPVGTVPPFGHHSTVDVLMDPSVLELDAIFAGGGSHNAMVKLDPKEILTVTKADIIDLHSKP